MRTDHQAPSGAAHVEHEFNSSSHESAPHLQALVDDVLRAAFPGTRNGDALVAGVADRDPMGELCAAARANDVRAETLILTIKDRWRHLPEFQGAGRLDAEIMLATVITGCIREYYGPGRT